MPEFLRRPISRIRMMSSTYCHRYHSTCQPSDRPNQRNWTTYILLVLLLAFLQQSWYDILIPFFIFDGSDGLVGIWYWLWRHSQRLWVWLPARSIVCIVPGCLPKYFEFVIAFTKTASLISITFTFAGFWGQKIDLLSFMSLNMFIRLFCCFVS